MHELASGAGGLACQICQRLSPSLQLEENCWLEFRVAACEKHVGEHAQINSAWIRSVECNRVLMVHAPSAGLMCRFRVGAFGSIECFGDSALRVGVVWFRLRCSLHPVSAKLLLRCTEYCSLRLSCPIALRLDLYSP